MFYSDVLLSKTGPLARVWLASNMERKLTKKDCLSSNINDSIEVMVDTGSAPMALRLSGQLLLGVCRIYSRKTRYLLEDCNEALLKIKMSNNKANVDLPFDQTHAVTASTLNIPDAFGLNLLDGLPDASLLLEQGFDLGRLADSVGLSNFDLGTQNLLPDSTEELSEIPRVYDDGDDLGLNLDDDGDFTSAIDIERGRERVAVPLEDEVVGDNSKLPDDDLGLNFDDDGDMTNNFSVAPLAEDVEMTDLNALDLQQAKEIQTDNDASLFQPQQQEDEDITMEPSPRQVKRRKVIIMDTALEINNAQMKEQQMNRSKTMKPASFLPRDPLLLALLSTHRSGGFISHILGNDRSSSWAPELRGMFSVEIIQRSGDLKRKRESGIPEDRLRLELPEDEESVLQDLNDGNADASYGQEELPSLNNFDDDNELPAPMSPTADFDETTIPLLHPADAGPISQGTQHAVHLLRNHFGPEGESSPNSRQKSSVLFQDLLPEKRTTKSEATRLFFEVLVLATKDAIKVEQKESAAAIGGPIRVRAKRGLWGAWAEQSAGGQIEAQDDEVEA